MDTPTVPDSDCGSASYGDGVVDTKPTRTTMAPGKCIWWFAAMVTGPLALLLLLWAPVAHAAEEGDCMHLVVKNTADAGPGSLRAALAVVCDGGAITFAPALTASGAATITLQSNELTIAETLTIEGPGANLLVVSGENRWRVFHVVRGVTAVISGLAIQDGSVGSFYGGECGGIHNDGYLTVQAARIVK
ncbi:MAG: hypothetical protein IPK16_11720, partial [Anaerolineales bacterium]|nr:hypothetical protein [Anaerolineales bacterium]